MSKLTALVEAAKAATQGNWILPWDCADRQAFNPTDEIFILRANPATILELCDLLTQAEEGFGEIQTLMLCGKKDQLPGRCDRTNKIASTTLTAIKQWKEQT